ncbi:MAG: hypothetical protein P1U68_08795 [Verrucomicrobiales bacterium]|nr:hypothetical protein [Verrucomicrobiales bacterium]
MKPFTSLIAALALLTGCSESPPEDTFVPPPVGVLDTGNFKVTLHSTPESPVYSLEDKEGNLVARHLKREEFASQFPEVFEEISSLWAGNDRGAFEADETKRPIFEDLLETKSFSPPLK